MKYQWLIYIIFILNLLYFSLFVTHKEERYFYYSYVLLLPLSSFTFHSICKFLSSSKRSKLFFAFVFILILISILISYKSTYEIVVKSPEKYIQPKGFLHFFKPYLLNKKALFTNDPRIGIYFNGDMIILMNYQSALKVIQNYSNVSFLFYNNCSYVCKKNDLDCNKKREEFKEFLSNKLLIFHKLSVTPDRKCEYSLYKIR